MDSARTSHAANRCNNENTHSAFVGLLNIINCNLPSVAWRKCHYDATLNVQLSFGMIKLCTVLLRIVTREEKHFLFCFDFSYMGDSD